jgi:glycosyltransferase involved in cell wall biosynthesis
MARRLRVGHGGNTKVLRCPVLPSNGPSAMRVLQIHKFFYPHAGSETVLFHTRELLASHGHEVIDFAMEHPNNVASPYSGHFAPRRDYVDRSRPLPSRARDALSSVYSIGARHKLRKLLQETRPDVAHMHIVYHQLTLSIVDELAQQGIPSVMTLHDYKIGCPAYVMYRDGEPCSLCTSGPVENVLLHRCIKGSRAASLLAAVEARTARVRGSYRKVDAYVAPSAFAGRVATATGVDPRTVHVIPNFLPASEIGEPVTVLDRQPRFFFAGRLEEVKGVREMLDVYSGDDARLGTLVLAGAGGELESEVQAASESNPSVEYLGRLSRDEVLMQMRRSRALLVPSRWHENNPMSLLEARAIGVPVICTDMGGLPEMVENGLDGLVVSRASATSLAAAIVRLAEDSELAQEMGRRGHERFLAENTPDVHYERLMAAYEAAHTRQRGDRASGGAHRREVTAS